MINLKNYFLAPGTGRQKQYEAIRAIVIENLPAQTVAEKYGYKIKTLYSLVRDAKAGKIKLFPENISKGPIQRRTPKEVQETIVKYRKEGNYSSLEICNRLNTEGVSISIRTVERILVEAGLPRLKKRPGRLRGVTYSKKR